jgi:sodium transport system permease protein
MIATLWTVMRKELLECFRDRRTLVNSLLIGPVLAPIFFMLVLKLALARAVSGQDDATPVTVVNAAAAANLVQQLREAGLDLTLREGSEADIRDWITAENQLVVLRVPERFGARFEAGEPAPLQVFADGADSKAGKRSARLAAAIAAYSARVAGLRLQARGISPTVIQPVVIDDVDVSTPSARATLFLGILSYVVLLATLMGGLYLAIDATAGERERGSLESLLTVAAVRDHLIYGKIAAAAVMMLIALAIVIASTALALKAVPLETFGMSANFGPDVVRRIFVAVAPFTLLASALLTVVASFTRTYKEAQSWLGLVLLVPTVPIALAGVLEIAPEAPLMLVPSLSQHLLIQGLIRGEPLPATWSVIAAASCLLLGVALAWLAGRLYRREAILG